MPVNVNTWEYYEDKKPEAGEVSAEESAGEATAAADYPEPFGAEEEDAPTQNEMDTSRQKTGGYFSGSGPIGEPVLSSQVRESEEPGPKEADLRRQLQVEIWNREKSVIPKALKYFEFEFGQGLGASIIKGFGDVSGAPEIISEARNAETEEFIAAQPAEEQHYYAWALNKEHALKIQEQLAADKATHQAFAEEQWYVRWPIQLGALIVDPASYIVGGPVAALTKPVGNAIMRMGATTGGFSVASQLLEEQKAWDEPFTLQGASLNVLASSITGMVLAAGTQLTKKVGAKLYSIVRERLSSNFAPEAFDISTGKIVDSGDNKLSVNWITAVQSQINSLTPIQQGISSPFKIIRDQTQRLLSTGGIYHKGEEISSRAITSAMDRNLGSREAYLRVISANSNFEIEFTKANRGMDRVKYFALLEQVEAGTTVAELEAAGIKKASLLVSSRKASNDFLNSVSERLWRAETFWEQKAGKPVETLSAANVRDSNLYLTDEANLLAEVNSPIPYRPRIYDKVEVYKKENEVKSLFQKGFLRQLLLSEKSMSRDAAEKKAAEQAKRAWEDIVGLGSERGIGHYVEGLRESQMTKARSILIDDRLLKKLGILVTDPYREATLLQERVLPYVHTQEVLNESGYRDFGEVRKVLKDEFDTLRAGAQAKGDEKAVHSLEREWRKANDQQLADMIDLAQNGLGLRNNMLLNPKLDLFLNSYRSLTYTRMLGKLPISQLADLPDIVKRFGLRPTLAEIFKTMRPGKRTGADKLLNDEIKALGLATEVENLKLRRFMEQSFVDQRDFEMVLPTTKHGPIANAIDTGIKTISYGFSRATFASEMNDWSKRIVSRLLLSNITKSLSKPYSTLTKAELKELSFLRITEEKHAQMAMEIAQAGEVVDGVLIPNVERWQNRKLAEAFQAEALSFVNKTIMTPTRADVPLWLNNKYLATLFMFKRFAFARTQHYYQNPNMPLREKMLTWLSTSISLSALSKGLKLLAVGKAIDLASPNFWYEVFEDGGLASNFSSMLMHFGKSIVDIISGKTREDGVGSVVRKELPFVNDVFDAFSALVKTAKGIAQDEPSKPWSEYQMNKFKQIFPFNGLWYLSPFVQYAIHQNRERNLAKTYENTWW